MIPCPDRDQLEAFLNNRLGAHEEGPLSLHIESCLRCQAELEQLTSVRQGPGSGPGDPCPADPRKTLPYAPPTAATNQGDTRPTSDILQALGHLIPAGAPTANRAADPLARHGSALPALPGFEVLEEIGRGGMGVVYKARHLRLNRVVAIKMLSRDYADTPDHLVRFHLEAEATARLQHPGVVQIFEFGTHGNQPYVVLEFAEGGSLARRLQGQPLPPHEAARLVKALAETVQAAHDLGIIHRDLKPANVLLGEHGTPKIADFGLAKLLHLDVKLTQSGTMAGTPSYMAPEQVLGQQDRVGPPTDVYALGAILYE
ncbi:MAG: serine/threonine protein kinase, partial [Planctomycetes bacterium]|nr:serine/threonine protein kinase [Planctomycetota bacterium]